ncbi:bifunctional nuclease family protein [Pseudonocardia sp. RS010]|uniref:bifunctional nuclease family protein n=1 Tax=Pseudonocardia sp. RS010 TaxID=3385979 RepID=UPI0039A33007
MRAMRVLRLVVHARSRQPVLVLGEVDGPRCVPIFLRPQQAEVIAVGPRDAGDPAAAETALAQDVLVPVVGALGARLTAAEITDLVDGVYTAELVLRDGAGAEVRVAVRPSDALAVAVREGLAIGVADAILDEVGQDTAELFPDGTDAAPAEQLREFREFLDDVTPDDFRR